MSETPQARPYWCMRVDTFSEPKHARVCHVVGLVGRGDTVQDACEHLARQLDSYGEPRWAADVRVSAQEWSA